MPSSSGFCSRNRTCTFVIRISSRHAGLQHGIGMRREAVAQHLSFGAYRAAYRLHRGVVEVVLRFDSWAIELGHLNGPSELLVLQLEFDLDRLIGVAIYYVQHE